MSLYKAEYLWIDGTKPTAKMRSKTKILEVGNEPDLWGFDGSSTNQAPGDASDCILNPVFTCRDPIRGGDNKLVLCEVLNTDMTPHASNTRDACVIASERFSGHQGIFGIEQEYTFLDGGRPLGWPQNGYPAPQGGYYCGVGADEVFGRDIVEAHMDACLYAGLSFCGVNAEVMPAQWEFQIGPISTPGVADQLWVARWLLYRIAEDFGVSATLNPKPVKGDWNGAGAHTNYSTLEMRESFAAIVRGCEALRAKADLHVANYGAHIDKRLTGLHETCSYKDFKWGVSDRGASIRIPWQVERAGKGYLEDRRPNANCDPYVVTRLLLETTCDVKINKTRQTTGGFGLTGEL
jgi:glutamine synthetase